MVIRKANTYRLYPTPEQAQQMAQIAGSSRYVSVLWRKRKTPDLCKVTPQSDIHRRCD